MVLSQEANDHNLRKSFRSSTQNGKFNVLIRMALMR